MGKYDFYSFYDRPVPYVKDNRELLIYPVLMTDYLMFHFFAECLLLDKNAVPDVKVISMKYFEYMLYATDDKTYYSSKFCELMKLVTRNPKLDIRIGKFNGKDVFQIMVPLKVNGEYVWEDEAKTIHKTTPVIYNSEDFDVLKEMIAEQNCLTLIDENISKEVRDLLEQAEEFKRRTNGVKMASLEDQMICVMTATPLKLEDIYKLTIRKFVKTLQRVDFKLHYQIYMAASMSGMVEFKDKSILKHWMADIEKKPYEDVMVDPENIKRKIDLTEAREQIEAGRKKE